VSNEALRGQVTLYSFSYTDCAEECSQSGADIAAVRDTLAQELGNGRSALQFITISLNPEQDTPEKLSHFADQWTSDNNHIPWQWLTGESQQIRATVGGGFDLYYVAEENGRIQFQPRYVLVDRLGMIRARYFQAIPDTEILLRDINFLTEEAANSEGAQALAYEAAHLFACYPR
jgi:protein SCO1/2